MYGITRRQYKHHIERSEARIADKLGLSRAGLRYLMHLHATTKPPHHGLVTVPLVAVGLITRDGALITITPAGTAIAERARELGW